MDMRDQAGFYGDAMMTAAEGSTGDGPFFGHSVGCAALEHDVTYLVGGALS
jgi:hypothetical protein